MKRLVSFIGFLAIIFISSCEEDNLPPYGTIITPVDGEDYNQGDEIQIKINATDPDGSIEEVDFFSFNEKETFRTKMAAMLATERMPMRISLMADRQASSFIIKV